VPFSFGLIFILSLLVVIEIFELSTSFEFLWHEKITRVGRMTRWVCRVHFNWVANSEWMVSVPTVDLAIINCPTVKNYHDWWALPVMFDCGDLASFVLWRGGFDVFVGDFHFLFTNQKRTHTCCGWESLWPWVGGDLEWSCIGGIMELSSLS